jgi:hypothetical protein
MQAKLVQFAGLIAHYRVAVRLGISTSRDVAASQWIQGLQCPHLVLTRQLASSGVGASRPAGPCGRLRMTAYKVQLVTLTDRPWRRLHRPTTGCRAVYRESSGIADVIAIQDHELQDMVPVTHSGPYLGSGWRKGKDRSFVGSSSDFETYCNHANA